MSDEPNTNIRQFNVIRDFLHEHNAPADVWEAIEGLYGRWQLGVDMNRIRQESWRQAEARVKELETLLGRNS